eukprot:scaffold28493_cov59-Attheya_sp.AAC.1
MVPGSIPGVIAYLCDFFKSRGRRVSAISFEAVVWNVLVASLAYTTVKEVGVFPGLDPGQTFRESQGLGWVLLSPGRTMPRRPRVGCFLHGVGESGKDKVFVIWGEVFEEWVKFEFDSFEEDEPALPSQSSLLPSCCGDCFLTGIVRSKDVIQEIISGGSGRISVTVGSCEAVEGEA